MRTYPLNVARAEFSKLVDRALAGEPQRVTRYGKEAVVIVSEVEWAKRPPSSTTLADLFTKHAGEAGYDDLFDGERPWTESRPPGSDFLGDDD